MMKADISIRRAEDSDLEWIAGRQVAMASETEGLALQAEVVRAGVAHVIGNPATGWYLVAELAGRPVGCLLVLKEWSDWRNGEVWWIHSVYVEPDARRSGIYRSMYGYLKRMVAQTEGVWGLRLYVDKRNGKAMKAYAALGMDSSHYALFEWLK